MPVEFKLFANGVEVRNGEDFILLSYNTLETNLIQVPVFDLTDFKVSDQWHVEVDFYETIRHYLSMVVSKTGVDLLVQCRMPSSKKIELEFLQSLGFQYRELTQHPVLRQGDLVQPEFSANPIDFKVEKVRTRAQVDRLASEYGKRFVIGRLQGDTKVSQSHVEKRFYSWIISAFSNPIKELIEIRDSISGENLGMFLARRDLSSTIFWELTAVNPTSASKGLAKFVFYAVAQHYVNKGFEIRSNFSSENLKLFKVYLNLGFSLDAPSVAMHWWQKL